MNFISGFLISWLTGKVLDKGFSLSSEKLLNEIDSIINNDSDPRWSTNLDSEQEKLIIALEKTSTNKWTDWLASLRPSTSRPIVIVGPSGVGKTVVGMRLAGLEPKNVKTSRDYEIKELNARLKSTNICIATGSNIQTKGSAYAIDQLKDKNSPKVLINVVAGGYHATASQSFYGSEASPNYSRPGTDQVFDDLDSFLNYCREIEEVNCLDSMYQSCKEGIKTRIPSIITIGNKRDIWQMNKEKAQALMNEYTRDTSDYGKKMLQLREILKNGDSLTRHDFLPVYLDDNGFSPNPGIGKVGLTQRNIEADTMVMKALVFLRYTEGSLRHD